MFRPPGSLGSRLLALAAAAALTWIAAPAPPAMAQEAVPTEQETRPVRDPDVPEEEEEYEEELLPPSDTGYIDDAVVASKLRLRYDSATGATRPDRAEFIYGKCLCFSAAFGQDAASPGPAGNLDFEELELTYEYAFSNRFSLFLEVPLRSIDLDIGKPLQGRVDTSGLGDLRAGMKYALIAERDRYVTFQLRGYFASGDAEKALGTDHASIEPGILFFSRPSERVTLASELRWWHPLSGSSDPVTGRTSGELRNEIGRPGDDGPDGTPGTDDDLEPLPPDPALRNDEYAGDVLRFGFGASYAGRGSRIKISPVAELVGWYVLDGWVFPAQELPREGLEGLVALEADNDTIVNLKLGARLSGLGPGSIYVGYGLPLSDDDWYDGIFRFEYRLPLAGPRGRKVDRSAREDADGQAMQGQPGAAAAAPPRPQVERIKTEQITSPEPQAGRPPGGLDSGRPPEATPDPAAAEPTKATDLDAAADRSAEPAASVEAPAAPVVVAPAAASEERVLAAVRAWSQAWSSQQLDAYLASYSPDFRPSRGMSRSAWQTHRRARIADKSFIRVFLDGVQVSLQGPLQATVDFTQRYESDSYSDTVEKRLVMRREDGEWKILREEASQ